MRCLLPCHPALNVFTIENNMLKADFIKQITELMPNEAEALLSVLQTEPVVSVRVNTRKQEVTQAVNPVKWCEAGRYLEGRPQFTFDPLFHAGQYYVQDASSMFLYHILKQISEGDVRYLDLCAAPGGKTTTAIEALSNDSLVVANEIDYSRAQILRENVIKWGAPNVMVLNDTPKKIGKMKNFFDIISADMPCSGEGMFRKEEEAVRQWTPSLVEQCAERQKSILDDVWSALRPGGYFIYSTCTFNQSENEDIAKLIVEEYGAEPVDIQIDPTWKITSAIGTDIPCYRFMPHKTKGEGLFVAVFRKAGSRARFEPKPIKKKGKNVPVPKGCADFLSRKMILDVDTETVNAYLPDLALAMHYVKANANAILCGVEVAQIKGKDVVPAHALSQSILLNRDAFTCYDVDYKTAIAYLRGEQIVLPQEVNKGFVLITYTDVPLGWVKNLGNRANNLYPKEWRIRSIATPETPPRVL